MFMYMYTAITAGIAAVFRTKVARTGCRGVSVCGIG